MFFLLRLLPFYLFFFFNDTATTEIYTLSLHDALPICKADMECGSTTNNAQRRQTVAFTVPRSEEHTSELQSPCNLVCRLLLEKKKKKHYILNTQALNESVMIVLLTCVVCGRRTLSHD